jgi:hypothetical protein
LIIAARYSFNGGAEAVAAKYPHLLKEIEACIHAIDADAHRTKESTEITMMGKMLYSPVSLNEAFKKQLQPGGWHTERVRCEYSTEHYTTEHIGMSVERSGFREMDFVKEKLGVEVQFGKYSFMVYNVAAKMTIFRNLGFIDAGIEIVPVRGFSFQMSSGVSYFEQFTWDLDKRGVADIDVPVLILGIDRDGGSNEQRPRNRENVVREARARYASREQRELDID